jgi:hypothetical protein
MSTRANSISSLIKFSRFILILVFSQQRVFSLSENSNNVLTKTTRQQCRIESSHTAKSLVDINFWCFFGQIFLQVFLKLYFQFSSRIIVDSPIKNSFFSLSLISLGETFSLDVAERKLRNRDEVSLKIPMPIENFTRKSFQNIENWFCCF